MISTLTGYIPGAEAVSVVGDLAKELKADREANGQQLVYVLDRESPRLTPPTAPLKLTPSLRDATAVLGDHGTLYVAESVIPIYRSLLPLATIITPNQFEAECVSPLPHSLSIPSPLTFPIPRRFAHRTLANLKVTSLATLRSLLLHLHTTYDLPHIIITSFTLPPSPTNPSLPAPPPAYLDRLATSSSSTPVEDYPSLTSVASSYAPASPDGSEPAKLDTTLFAFPLIPGYFSGVGDLFSALTLAHFVPPTTSSSSTGEPSPLARAAGRALYSTQMVLLSTHLRAEASGDVSDGEKDAEDRGRRVRRMTGRELRVVGREARGDLEGEGCWAGKVVDLPEE